MANAVGESRQFPIWEGTKRLLQGVGGAAQVIGGATVCAGVVTCAGGAVVIAHGLGNLGQATGIVRDNITKYAYIGAAEHLGASRDAARDIGSATHLTVDIGTAISAALTKVPRVGAWKLFNWTRSDLQYSVQTRAGFGLAGVDTVNAIEAISARDNQ